MPLKFGKAKVTLLLGHAKWRLLKLSLTYLDEILTTRERKAMRQMQRKLLSNAELLPLNKTTLSAIKAAKDGNLTEVSHCDL